MAKELEKTYNPSDIEQRTYEKWLDKKYFHAKINKDKKPFTIVMPPPNITGQLHMGHALDNTLQDILIRFKRMQGYEALWLPGTDHASIATEAKVVEAIKEEGLTKEELGREKFLERVWDWKKQYGGRIVEQLKKMGSSCDWDRERFTMDEGCNKAVKEVFVKLYDKGLIYRGKRIINWCPKCLTSISDAEVEYEEQAGHFWHLRYKTTDGTGYIDLATTRPETLLGDTAVAINPNDSRYKHMAGKMLDLPIVHRQIPIIEDEYVDMEFGTGVVKITPAHDPNDFEVGNRHNLERIVVMKPDATMNANALKYEGMSREECREALLEDLKHEDLLINIEPMTHSVGHSERTGVMVEPYLSKQWFVRMGTLAKRVLETQKKSAEKVNFVPDKFEKTLTHWMEECFDWCISRQLWWGHRIPAWYKGEEVYVGESAPTGDGWVQDEDVLDTWFSSALWPFSTLGWPESTEDMERYYPNDCLVTAYDIIFFWVARMVFQAEHITGSRPFKDCVIHGLIRDKQGRKMSKSLGNGVDPMDMIEKYGVDALRYYLATDVAPGTDLRFDEEKLSSTWNYINKIWNASRFVLLNIEDLNEARLEDLSDEDKWILTKYERVIKSTIKHMDKYEFNLVGTETYNFIYDDFCSNYIEFAKYNLDKQSTKSTLFWVLSGIIQILHPFMPFVTEEIYQMLPIKTHDSIMISDYPIYDKSLMFEAEEKLVDEKIEFIKNFRNVKAENSIPKDALVKINTEDEIIIKMLKLSDVLTEEDLSINSYEVKTQKYQATIYFEKQVTEEELKLKEKQINDLESSIERRKKLLANENYVAKAPAELVEKERKTLESEEEQLALLKK